MACDKTETLVALCESTAWASDTDEVFQNIVDASVTFLGCDEAHLHLLDFDGNNLARRASAGEQSAGMRGEGFPADLGRSRRLLQSGDLIIMEDYDDPDPADVIPKAATEMGFKSAISIPLGTPQGVIGMLSIVYKSELPWAADDYAYLVDVGRVLGVAVQRIQMSKKDLELEMLRERKRLSIEIHDNLSQMVSSLAMRTDTALMCYEEGNHEAVQDELERLGSVSRHITKVLREEMLSLRTPTEEHGGLVDGARGLLCRFEEQWGIKTELVLLSSGEFEISGHSAMHLLRILNECLSNVLRHAHASNVQVLLRERGSRIELTVKDDGCGFDVASVAPERLGIRIMQERASAARGSLRIESGAGGTTVHVEVARN